MTWVLRLTGDALADLKELPVWLQEEVLDELDRLCANPPHPRVVGDDREIVADFDRRFGPTRHVVFIRLRQDDQRSELVVLGIATCETPLGIG